MELSKIYEFQYEFQLFLENFFNLLFDVNKFNVLETFYYREVF